MSLVLKKCTPNKNFLKYNIKSSQHDWSKHETEELLFRNEVPNSNFVEIPILALKNIQPSSFMKLVFFPSQNNYHFSKIEFILK